VAAPDDDPGAQRWVAEPPKRSARTAYQRDRARVLHSAALRRLAAKTQVVAAGEADFPRTRLTHSLEVAQIGRELGQALGCDPDVVEVAGLAHDLGHPPFGHNGEAALDEVAQPYGGFEGNAQTLRVLTRLEAKAFAPEAGPLAGRSVGLNLTRASLDAATKYPWTRRDDSRKFGVYPEDLDVFDWLRQEAPGDRRCLEAQVMDWADDIAYSVHDVEDAVHGGHVTLAQLLDPAERTAVAELAARTYAPDAEPEELEYALLRLQAQPWWPRGYDGSMHALAALKNLTSELIGRFCTAAEEATRHSYTAPQLSRYGADLVVPRPTRLECAALKAVAAVYVMQRDGAGPVYAQQQQLVQELYVALLRRAPEGLAPELRPAFEAATDDTARVRVVIDQVASLTDISVVAVHRRLTGSSVTVVGGERNG
jgi:dGTPase